MTKKNEKEYVDPLLWQLVDLGIGAAKETLTENLEAHIGALHLCSVINADTTASPSKSIEIHIRIFSFSFSYWQHPNPNKNVQRHCAS
jgi:hypothetical protein